MTYFRDLSKAQKAALFDIAQEMFAKELFKNCDDYETAERAVEDVALSCGEQSNTMLWLTELFGNLSDFNTPTSDDNKLVQYLESLPETIEQVKAQTARINRITRNFSAWAMDGLDDAFMVGAAGLSTADAGE